MADDRFPQDKLYRFLNGIGLCTLDEIKCSAQKIKYLIKSGIDKEVAEEFVNMNYPCNANYCLSCIGKKKAP